MEERREENNIKEGEKRDERVGRETEKLGEGINGNGKRRKR